MIHHTITLVATAYCLRGTMANGRYTHHGAAATDPSVLPTGTRFVYRGRVYTAEDTGGDVQGNRVDIWMESCRDAINYGNHIIHVRILR